MSFLTTVILFFLICVLLFMILVAVMVELPETVELSEYTPDELIQELNNDFNNPQIFWA